jgi:hypothetical protein
VLLVYDEVEVVEVVFGPTDEALAKLLREPSKTCSNPRTKRSWWLC